MGTFQKKLLHSNNCWKKNCARGDRGSKSSKCCVASRTPGSALDFENVFFYRLFNCRPKKAMHNP